MKKICVVSKNPIKLESVKNAFEKMFPDQVFNFLGLSAPSEVSDQPLTEQETKTGAYNRVKNAKEMYSGYDYFVALEGGIQKNQDGTYECFAWACIEEINQERDTHVAYARSGSFVLPDQVGKYLDEGLELGEADDKVFNRSNSKQSNGAVGILTHDVITRTSFYSETICLALIPFKNPLLYK